MLCFLLMCAANPTTFLCNALTPIMPYLQPWQYSFAQLMSQHCIAADTCPFQQTPNCMYSTFS